MKYGISGAPVPLDLPYALTINIASAELDFPPLLAYAIANRETIRGERNGQWNAASVVSPDGGHGLFQLTSWVPPGWDSPAINTHWALVRWLLPSLSHYALHHLLRGDMLAATVADAFNAGAGAVCAACEHAENPDEVTTGHNYGADVVACFHALLTDGRPT